MNRNLEFIVLFLLSSLTGLAQAPQPDRLKVFVDCSSTWCDMDYVRTEINIVDFLMDRVAADVHILVTNQPTGSGGRNYQIIFYGQNRFKGFMDSLRFNTDPNSTDFERREKLVNYIKSGISPLVAKTNQADRMSIVMKADASSVSDSSKNETVDKWNYWVFRLEAYGNFEADQNYTSTYLNYGISANRKTDKLKFSFDLNAGRNVYTYRLTDTTGRSYTESVNNRNLTFDHVLVRSINKHWSYGYNFNIRNTTFSNTKIRTMLLGAVEYNIFPYSDVNTRLLTISYGVDGRQYSYYESTIFGKLDEVLVGHFLRLSTSLNQKWGSVNTGVAYHNYFSDWRLNSLLVQVETDVRITGGLSLWTFMRGGFIHDQVYLSSDEVTQNDVLTRRRSLASSYFVRIYFGLQYRFGSKLNNFVNPRFTGNANYLGD